MLPTNRLFMLLLLNLSCLRRRLVSTLGPAVPRISIRTPDENLKPAGTRRVPQLSQRLGFDLPDALPCDREHLAYFLERALASVVQAEPHADNPLLARR